MAFHSSRADEESESGMAGDLLVPLRARAVAMARVPQPGRGKRRLAADVGDKLAAQIYTELAKASVRAGAAGASEGVLVLHDGECEREDAEVTESLGVERAQVGRQRGESLGSRIEDAVARGTAGGTAAVVMATDAPSLSGKDVERAARAMAAGYDAALGPSPDGGFYLLGARKELPAGCLERVAWSTDRARGECCEALVKAGLRVSPEGLFRELADVDTAHDLEQWLHSASDADDPLRTTIASSLGSH